MKPYAVFVIATNLATTVALAQAGSNPALDGRLGAVGPNLAYQGRTGTFPTGTVRMSMATTLCNVGSVNVPQIQAPNPLHSQLAFMIARLEAGGTRVVQISDRCFVKHTFFPLSQNACGTCQCSNSMSLGISCSDTYTMGTNAAGLGPADDVDPWIGVWASATNPTALNTQCPTMTDASLTVSGASYFYCAQFGLPSWTQTAVGTTPCGSSPTGTPVPQPVGSPLGLLSEPDSQRNDNLASRQMTITYAANVPTFTSTGAQLDGTVLQRWPAATISSATNGDPIAGPSDGRVYVAVKVTGAPYGRYHYEYAVHDRDNKGGVGAFRLPTCPAAGVDHVGFHDVDVPANATNDWSFVNTGTELIWSAPPGNALRWNMLFNFWFDSDAAPIAGDATLDQATIVGGVNPSFTIATSVPTGLFNVGLGPGCSSGTPPALYAVGTPARASLGNASFGLEVALAGAGNVVDLYASVASGVDPQFGPPCNVYLGPDLSTAVGVASGIASGAGVVTFLAPVPNDPALEGVQISAQAVEFTPTGTLLGFANLSNGIRVRIGDAISRCP